MDKQKPLRLAGLMATLQILAREGRIGQGKPYRGSKTKCAACGKDIPPGRAGRRCQECRHASPEGQPPS